MHLPFHEICSPHATFTLKHSSILQVNPNFAANLSSIKLWVLPMFISITSGCWLMTPWICMVWGVGELAMACNEISNLSMPRSKLLITIEAKAFISTFFHLYWWQPLNGGSRWRWATGDCWVRWYNLFWLKVETGSLLIFNLIEPSQTYCCRQRWWFHGLNIYPHTFLQTTNETSNLLRLIQLPHSVKEFLELALVLTHQTNLFEPCKISKKIIKFRWPIPRIQPFLKREPCNFPFFFLQYLIPQLCLAF